MMKPKESLFMLEKWDDINYFYDIISCEKKEYLG